MSSVYKNNGLYDLDKHSNYVNVYVYHSMQ